MTVLATLALGVAALAARNMGHPKLWPCGVLGHVAATVIIYYSALNLRDRYAAVVAGALVATSLSLSSVAVLHPADVLPIITIAGLWLLCERGWLIAAAVAAALAAICRLDMLLLGIVALGYGIWLKKREAGTATAIYVVAMVAYLAAHFWTRQRLPEVDEIAGHGPVTVLWACGPAILWFITAFLTDLLSNTTRERWLPAATWLLLFVCLAGITDNTGSLSSMAPAFVAAYLIAASGIARVLPALAGDMPTPVARYTVAAIAVLLLLCLRYPSDSHASAELNAAKMGKVLPALHAAAHASPRFHISRSDAGIMPARAKLNK
ncbi:MAG: hypothetical protein P4L33_06550 [Capsulimonadaceae bacterium]|nr:hypothetical protein [Capsulimonadaceae bacterium]